MSDFDENLYSTIESDYKKQLKIYKNHANRANCAKIVLLFIVFVLLNIKFHFFTAIILFFCFFVVFTIVDMALSNKIKNSGRNKYVEYYIKNVVYNYINKSYNLNFTINNTLDEDDVDLSEINAIQNYNTITRKYKIAGTIKENQKIVISFLNGTKYMGPAGDNETSSIISDLIFCKISRVDAFNNVNLKLMTKADNLYNKIKNRNECSDFYKQYLVKSNTFMSDELKRNLLISEKSLAMLFS